MLRTRFWAKVWRDLENTRPRSGFAPKQVGTWAPGEGIFECGRIKAGGICAISNWEILGAISASGFWICQNKVQRPRYWGNIVEVFLDRFCTLGMARFYLYVVLQDGVQ